MSSDNQSGIQSLLKHLREKIQNSRDRGTAFEHLIKSYLTQDPKTILATFVRILSEEVLDPIAVGLREMQILRRNRDVAVAKLVSDKS